VDCDWVKEIVKEIQPIKTFRGFKVDIGKSKVRISVEHDNWGYYIEVNREEWEKCKKLFCREMGEKLEG